MTAPLYRGAASLAAQSFKAAADGTWAGNAGLWYDKFCDRWADDFSDLAGDDAKRAWIGTVIHPRRDDGSPVTDRQVKTGDRHLLAEHHARQTALAGALRGFLDDHVLDARLVSGLGRIHPVENGFGWHHSLGVPYLAGASVKGMVRAWAAHFAKGVTADTVDRLFGPLATSKSLAAGTIIVLDALPTAPVTLACDVMTPHYAPWYRDGEPPADWHSPTPIPYLAVEAGVTFSFGMLPRPGCSQDDLDTVRRWLIDALAWLGAGAKTAIGFGRFRPEDQPRPPGPEPLAKARPEKPTDNTSGPDPVPRQAFVDDEPVTIVGRDGDDYRVQFPNGDIEPVTADEITWK